MRAAIVVGVVALALGAVSGAAGGARAGGCPAAWKAGWQHLADRIQAPVYCPTWMPNPLDAKIGGDVQDIYSIGKDRSYLVSFLAHGDEGSGDVHVNFRGYPGKTSIPRCQTIILSGSKTIRGTTPCFAEPVGTKKAPGIVATVYRVNQDADQWHILLAWRHAGSLYTVSEHVINPYDSSTVVLRNLGKLLSGLVLVQPQG
ncbi:MAG TPA: hypothetical protein VGN27_00850 [Gaiellaceae bacterium]|jgi:hypothetical protein|nr:hypothetical protein [Gaiellaceae bacterium]